MAAAISANWRSQFGDPDPLGWTITAAYFVVALLCARAGASARRAARPPPAAGGFGLPPARTAPWLTLAVGMALLGLNKQLDLQLLLRDAGIALVHAAGWDAWRRWAGRSFVLLLSLAAAGAMAVALRHLNQTGRRHRLLLLGLTLLACFVLLRAGMYLPILRQLNLRWHRVFHVAFELGALLLIGTSALRTRPHAEPLQPPRAASARRD